MVYSVKRSLSVTVFITLLWPLVSLFSVELPVVHAASVAENERRLLETKKCIKCDLRGASLAFMHLVAVDLRGADLRGADLSGTNLKNAKLVGARLIRTVIEGANMQAADLSGADLHGADVQDADMRGVKLREANLIRTDFRGAEPACGRPAGCPDGTYRPPGGKRHLYRLARCQRSFGATKDGPAQAWRPGGVEVAVSQEFRRRSPVGC